MRSLQEYANDGVKEYEKIAEEAVQKMKTGDLSVEELKVIIHHAYKAGHYVGHCRGEDYVKHLKEAFEKIEEENKRLDEQRLMYKRQAEGEKGMLDKANQKITELVQENEELRERKRNEREAWQESMRSLYQERDEAEQGRIKALNERDALEEKLDFYENGEDSKSITYFINENANLREAIRSLAKVL